MEGVKRVCKGCGRGDEGVEGVRRVCKGCGRGEEGC